MSDTHTRVKSLLAESAEMNATASDLYARYERAQREADRLENEAYDLEDRG